jgi:hypothetical protein
MVIECTSATTEADAKALLAEVGAHEIHTQVAEAGWWLGTYDKEQKLYDESYIKVAHH